LEKQQEQGKKLEIENCFSTFNDLHSLIDRRLSSLEENFQRMIADESRINNERHTDNQRFHNLRYKEIQRLIEEGNAKIDLSHNQTQRMMADQFTALNRKLDEEKNAPNL
jgi:aspartyl/asparaginyl-tRNA synthetase